MLFCALKNPRYDGWLRASNLPLLALGVALGAGAVLLSSQVLRWAHPSAAKEVLSRDEPMVPPAPVAPAEPPPSVAVPRTAFEALPLGMRQVDGVMFSVPRPVNIIGLRAALKRANSPGSVANVAVRQSGRHIHVLHMGDHGVSRQGTPIWRLVAHYENGEQREFDFSYGVHLRDYWRHAGEPDSEITDPNTTLAWKGRSEESDRVGAELRVYHTTLVNPLPTVPLTKVDYVTLLGDSSAYVFCVQVNDEGGEPKRSEALQNQNRSILRLKLVDAQGQPLAGMYLRPTLTGSSFRVRYGEHQSDLNGVIKLDIPGDLEAEVNYQARNPAGGVQTGKAQFTSGAAAEHAIQF